MLPDRDIAGRRATGARLDPRPARGLSSIGVPVESIYHWRGKAETAKEVPVTIEMRQHRYAAVEIVIRAVDSCELPEIVIVPICDAFTPYLDWIAAAAVAPPPD